VGQFAGTNRSLTIEAMTVTDAELDWVTDAQAAATTTATERFDLVLLDLGLPKGNGLDVLRGIRARDDSTPVIVLTAKGGIDSAVAMVRAMPSISCGFTSSAVSSSLAAPANFDSTSTPGDSGFCAATYSLATRFMPSCNGVTTPTCAVR